MTQFTAVQSNGGASNGRVTDQNPKSESSNGSSNGHRNGKAAAPTVDEYADVSAFAPLFPGSSIDRRELVKLTLQSLREMGYDAAAKTLENESGVTLEHPSITAFRTAVLSGDWRNAERLLIDGLTYAARRIQASRSSSGALDGPSSEALPSSSAGSSFLSLPGTQESPNQDLIDTVLRRPHLVSLRSIRFMLQKQRYLELLEARQTKKALNVLREKLTPLSHDTSQLHLLSSLVISASPEQLHARANWDGADGESRRLLMMEIESAVSPLVMIPSRRLPQLLEQAQSYQKQQDPFFNSPHGSHFSLLTDHRSDRSVFPSHVSRTIEDHHDEVWCLEFSHDGTKLATAGADKTILIWSVQDDYKLLQKFVPLSDNISSVSWSPNDKKLLVTSDVDVTLCQLENGSMLTLREHSYTVATAAWRSDGSGFVTGGMDGKIVWWDMEGYVLHKKSTSPFRVLAVAATPDGEHLVALSARQVAQTSLSSSTTRGHTSSSTVLSTSTASDHLSDSSSPSTTSTSFGHDRADLDSLVDLAGGSRTMGSERYRIHFLNLRTREELGSIYLREEVVSLAVSRDSQYALINVRPNELQMWDISRQCLVRRFNGHKLSQHVIGCGFGGIDENFVISGSEDAKIYIWHRASGRLIETLTGHEIGSVNAVAWHPKDALTVASCGDDHTVRIWRPGGRLPASAAFQGDAAPKSDDSEISGAANPFPWSFSEASTAGEADMMQSIHEAMDEEDVEVNTPSPVI
ncbi:WD40 repeat [Kalmanozyma brasiliensis GHG001]|uniref:WD40 repeat n=1 Tax=Kalmanozyma brasiliensis (strain GHG001) TaxID=1365824 RepID=UPI0028681E47|nr:WD40 repeat [Kalmanozyma brasiliensis GHG001]EST05149.2 WD40 repeat [Kalmanozyma brasiliensis GHG001]